MRTLFSLGALASLFPLAAVAGVACGGAPPDTIPEQPGNYGYASGSGSGGGYGYGYDAGATVVPEAGVPEGGPSEAEASAPPIPPIATTAPLDAPVACAGGSSPTAYLLAYDGTLFAFDPGSLETRSLGVVSCVASTTIRPYAFTVAAPGTAYVLYDDGNIYAVDLTTLDCEPTRYQQNQLDLNWHVGITVGAGTAADRLYYYGQGASPLLAVSDLTSFQLFELGPTGSGLTALPADLKSDAYGRLFALGAGGVLQQLDPATGAILGQDSTGFDCDQNGWALLPYDGQLYFVSGPAGGVSRYDVTTKALFPLGQVNQAIVGAGTTPCLSADALPPQNPDAGAPASPPPGPFSAGDAWMGTYVCPQGLTNLVLAIESVDGNAVRARFDFDWVEQATQGSYELTGTFDPSTREATFTPGAWVSDPGSTWYPVGMDGFVDLSGQSYAGSITSTGCGAFSVTR
jgi:hypothetical protein